LFNPSAFKHRETEADIYRAIETKIYEGRMKAKMAYMTDEEADALDNELTRTIPELGPNGEGFFPKWTTK